MKLPVDPKRIVDAPMPVVEKILNPRKKPFERFPLLFTLLAAFGLVATFYGFEGIINKIDFFTDHPFILLVTGLSTLIITGTLYKKL